MSTKKISAKEFDAFLSEPVPDGEWVVLTGSVARRVAFIIGTYKGGTVEQNLPVAQYIVDYVGDFMKHRPVK